jgi:hypothetical protein
MRLKLVLVMTVVAVIALGGVAMGQGGDSDFVAELSGDNEVPPVETRATGVATFNRVGGGIHFELKVEDGRNLFGAAGAHIHCAPAGENGPVVVFLAGAVPGGFDGDVEVKATFDEANIVDTSCGATLRELIQSMRDGNTYVNVHTTQNPGGEIRGQIEEG